MKTQTTIRIEKTVLTRLKELAKNEHRSLNNFLECLLTNVVERTPNKETEEAIKEAREHKKLEEIKDIDEFVSSI